MRKLVFIAVTISLCASAFGQPEFLIASQTDPGVPGNTFGTAMAATAKFIYVSSPTFDRLNIVDSGWVFKYDAKTYAPAGTFDMALAANNKSGMAMAATKTNVLIGSPFNDTLAGADAGMVVLVQEKLNNSIGFSAPQSEADDQFGASVAITNKLLVVGAPNDKGGSTSARSGSAFVSQLKEVNFQRLQFPAYVAGDKIGYAVAANNKFIVVGAPKRYSAFDSYGMGAIHIFDAKTYSYLTTIYNYLAGNGELGSSLVLTNKYLYAGAPRQNFGNPGTPGAVFFAGTVIEYNLKDFSINRVFYPTDPQRESQFGASILVVKNRLIVGAPLHDSAGTSDGGAVYTFDLKTGAQLGSRQFPDAGYRAGSSLLALPKGIVAVGAPSSPDVRDGVVELYTSTGITTPIIP